MLPLSSSSRRRPGPSALAAPGTYVRTAVSSLRLPQFDLVAFRVDEVAERAVVVVGDLADDGGAAGPRLFQHAGDVVDDEVQHELFRARREIVGALLERRPHRAAAGRHRAGLELDAAPLVDREAEVLCIPVAQFLRIRTFEKHAADTECLGHCASPIVWMAGRAL